MADFIGQLDFAALHESWFIWIVLTTFGAALVRGLTGFGSAMIMIPVLSAFLSPVVAVPILNLVDAVTSLPMLRPAMKQCRWREVIPLFLGAVVLMPLGVHLLQVVDPVLLRHVMAVLILGMAIVMAFGLRYQGEPNRFVSLAVGAVSGLMSGAIGLSGPPVILFWLGGQANAITARANVIAYFGLMTVALIATMIWNGLFTGQVIALSLVLMPVYALGLALGARGFRFASEHAFRYVALTLIAAVAVISLFK
ncbi:MAG TPA: sulfite exporter TauE/SafE family protein [Terriglobales bacterium]|nr:sulfite exporter TauE/SafE family protein [Terriglobales bacterium]